MFLMPSIRRLSGLMTLFCLGLIAVAMVLQFVYGLAPCPLCVVQRAILFVVMFLFLIGAIYEPSRLWRRGYYFVVVLMAFLGVLTAARQVWLQHLPAGKVPSCGMGLDFMLANLPLSETITLLFHGTAECSKVQWVFLGLSIPEWTTLSFSFLMAIGVIQLLRTK